MVSYEVLQDIFEIKGSGRVVSARLLQDVERKELSQIIGAKVFVDGQTCEVKAVESFALSHLSAGMHIGLLIKEPKTS